VQPTTLSAYEILRSCCFGKIWTASRQGVLVQSILPHVSANRGVNKQGDGKLFDRSALAYQREPGSFLCPAVQTLNAIRIIRERPLCVLHRSCRDLRSLPVKSRCGRKMRGVPPLASEALQRMRQRATPESNADQLWNIRSLL
jgi:hypothetical protein